MHHATVETVEDRGAGEGHRTPGIAVVCTILRVSANFDAGTGEYAALPGVAPARITPPHSLLPDGAPWGGGFARPGGARTPDIAYYTAQIRPSQPQNEPSGPPITTMPPIPAAETSPISLQSPHWKIRERSGLARISHQLLPARIFRGCLRGLGDCVRFRAGRTRRGALEGCFSAGWAIETVPSAGLWLRRGEGDPPAPAGSSV